MQKARRGRLIAIEGIDQSGKKTQARLLSRKLTATGHANSIWNFPDYATPLGRQIRAYLRGRIKLDYHAAHLLYAANRWEKAAEISRAIQHGINVIVNRYSQSNLAYGVAHNLSLDWLISLERDLPCADLVLLLDVSPRASYNRKELRRDLHEENEEYLISVRNAYLHLARKYRWKVLTGENDPKAVHLRVWEEVSRTLPHKRTIAQ